MKGFETFLALMLFTLKEARGTSPRDEGVRDASNNHTQGGTSLTEEHRPAMKGFETNI